MNRYFKLLIFGLLMTVSLSAGCNKTDEKLVRMLDVTYDRQDGHDLKLDFVRPEGDGPFPLVVCVHGGGWRQGSRTEYKEFQNSMAAQGIATASVQYRFAPTAKFPAQLNDVRSAVQFVVKDQARFKVDRSRIIWMGGSAGGHLSLLAGLEKSELYTTRLIINVAGPTDLRTFKSLPTGDAVLKQYVTRDSSELLADLLGTPDRTADIYRTASPVELIRSDSPRVITFHGDKDDIVPVTQAEALHEKLKELKVPEKLVIGAGGGHDFGGWPQTELLRSLNLLVEEIKTAIKVE